MRFRDEGKELAELMEEVWVACPRCGERGKVTCELPWWKGSPRFACTKCAYSLQGWQSGWFGLSVGQARCRCKKCEAWLGRKLSQVAPHEPSVPLTCAVCGAKNKAPVSWTEVRFGQPYDPYFGLRLWLQAPCRGETLWAYNPQHLEFIEQSVGTRVRQRVPYRNKSLASRLPRWVKSARNREAVLEAIAAIKEMAKL
jgi:hypothetical protein